jgi:hypothetical protein
VATHPASSSPTSREGPRRHTAQPDLEPDEQAGQPPGQIFAVRRIHSTMMTRRPGPARPDPRGQLVEEVTGTWRESRLRASVRDLTLPHDPAEVTVYRPELDAPAMIRPDPAALWAGAGQLLIPSDPTIAAIGTVSHITEASPVPTAAPPGPGKPATGTGVSSAVSRPASACFRDSWPTGIRPKSTVISQPDKTTAPPGRSSTVQRAPGAKSAVTAPQHARLEPGPRRCRGHRYFTVIALAFGDTATTDQVIVHDISRYGGYRLTAVIPYTDTYGGGTYKVWTLVPDPQRPAGRPAHGDHRTRA